MTEQIKNNIEDLVNKSRQAQELLNDIDERKINIFFTIKIWFSYL